MIRAKDPHLHQISVAVEGFLLPEGAPIPKGTLTTQPIPEGIPTVPLPPQHTADEATSSHPIIKEKEEVVEVLDSEDDFKAFNLLSSPRSPAGDLGITSLEQVGHPQEETTRYKHNGDPTEN